MTTTQVVHPIIAAVARLDDVLGPERQWNSQSGTQQTFLQQYYPRRDDLSSIPEIESIAGRIADVINQWLASRGYSIRMDQFRPTEVGAAAALKLLEKWVAAGTETTVQEAGSSREYPAALMPEGDLQHFTVDGHPHPIGLLHGENGDEVYMTMYDYKPSKDPFDLIRAALAMREGIRYTDAYSTLTFPMADVDVTTPLNWLLNMWTYDQEGFYTFVSQAKQQSKLKLNHLGALMESGVTVGAMRFAFPVQKQPHVINRPFLYSAWRPGASLPVFVAHITQESWKNPGNFMS